MTRTRMGIARILAATALLLAMAAPASAADTAMVRVLHASPDAPAVDVQLDDTVDRSPDQCALRHDLRATSRFRPGTTT